MYISHERLDLFARYIVATKRDIHLANLLLFYGNRLKRIEEETPGMYITAKLNLLTYMLMVTCQKIIQLLAGIVKTDWYWISPTSLMVGIMNNG